MNDSDLITLQPVDPSRLRLAEVEVLPALPEEPVDIPYTLRSKLTAVVEEHMEDIVEGQVELARGLWFKEYVKDKNGNFISDEYGKPKIKVYQKAPDKDAGQYLLNQVIGKPKENMVVAGKVNFILDL